MPDPPPPAARQCRCGDGRHLRARQGDTLPPVTLLGGGLRPITYAMPTPSAQVKSAVLLAGSLLRAIMPRRRLTRDHTERMLRGWRHGDSDGPSASVHGPARLRPAGVCARDISWLPSLVAAAIVPGSEVP